MLINVSAFMASALRVAACYGSMDSKDGFMRFVVIGSIVAVGAFALFITLHS
jgi:hypothetical protein